MSKFNKTELAESFEQEFYGDVELRWYQIAARNGVADALEKKINRVLIVKPTGSGKTLTIACSLSYEPIRQALGVKDGRPLRVLYAAHMHRLLSQAENTFAKEANVEIIPHCYFSDIPEDVLKEGWDVCVLDEAHHEACMSFQLQLEDLDNAPIIGLTATPDRPDGSLIKFEAIIEPISREQAVEEGYLAETNLNSFLDTSGTDKTEVLMKLFKSYAEEMGQTMVFVRTKREVTALTLYLQKLGYSAVSVMDQNPEQLDRVLKDFELKKIKFLVNCYKIGEGVDVKGCSDVVLGRQLGSYTQLNQIVGRAARPDCDCNVWELINPLSDRNLDTTVVVGTPKRHRLVYQKSGEWVEQEFDYAAAA